MTCKCGYKVFKYDLKQHERTKEHMDLIKFNNNILFKIKYYCI
jgi:hypothetical protein